MLCQGISGVPSQLTNKQTNLIQFNFDRKVYLDIFLKTHSASLECLLNIFFFGRFGFMQKISNFINKNLEHIFFFMENSIIKSYWFPATKQEPISFCFLHFHFSLFPFPPFFSPPYPLYVVLLLGPIPSSRFQQNHVLIMVFWRPGTRHCV